MTFNIRQLDNLDYDAVEPILDDYINSAIEEFANSPEGDRYIEAHPIGGNWIGEFINLGYVYEGFTLPKMTKGDVKVLMESIFPRKLTLLDPSEANDAIPELVAFWKFLKRKYSFRSADAIIKYLKTLDGKFSQMMNDPAKGGIAKQFILGGQAAGFDMTTEEGVKAFQEQYNQQIRNSGTPPIPLSGGFSALLSNMAPPSGKATDSPEAQLQNILNTLAAAMGEQLPSAADAENADSEDGDFLAPFSDFQKHLQVEMMQKAAAELPPLSEQAIALLKQQSISETEPGTILCDFQILLDQIGEKGTPVSAKQHTLPTKLLADLNRKLSTSVHIDLKRPVQKSYPTINGLYLLLRTSGLGQIIGKGSKRFLVLEPTLLQSWNQLNPTERYFSLLEAWLIRSHSEILTGENRDPLNEGTKCIQFWTRISDQGQQFNSYAEQHSLNYWPEFHNLALMQMFGLLQVETSKPEPGKGWRVKKIQRLPLGDALMQVVTQAALEHEIIWDSETDPTIPFGELQPALQPYFPKWQNSLAVPVHEFRTGVFIFRVSLGKIWRRLAISSQMPLADLGRLILESVDFDFDHLDMFIYKNQVGRTIEIKHPYVEEPPSTEEVRIGDLLIAVGTSMTYVFDFGDWWEFEVQLEEIQSDDPRTDYAAIVESHGEAPQQYPDWDE